MYEDVSERVTIGNDRVTLPPQVVNLQASKSEMISSNHLGIIEV